MEDEQEKLDTDMKHLIEHGQYQLLQHICTKVSTTVWILSQCMLAALRNILNNRFYLGEMTYGKTVRKSVGSKKSVRIPKGEWKVILFYRAFHIAKGNLAKDIFPIRTLIFNRSFDLDRNIKRILKGMRATAYPARDY